MFARIFVNLIVLSTLFTTILNFPVISRANQNAPHHSDWDRRALLRAMIFTSASAAINTTGVAAIEKVVSMGVKTEADKTYVRSVIEAQLLAIGNELLIRLFPKGALGNAAASLSRSEVRFDSVTYAKIALFGPAFEEVIFRLLPFLFIGNSWYVGIPTAAVFAVGHNLAAGNFLDDIKDLKRIPVPQFLAGILFWYLIKEKGFSHAVVGHMSYNSSLYVAHYLDALYPARAR